MENWLYAVISVLPLNMLWVYFANFCRWVFTSFGKMGTFDLVTFNNKNIGGSHDAVGWSNRKIINDELKTKSLRWIERVFNGW